MTRRLGQNEDNDKINAAKAYVNIKNYIRENIPGLPKEDKVGGPKSKVHALIDFIKQKLSGSSEEKEFSNAVISRSKADFSDNDMIFIFNEISEYLVGGMSDRVENMFTLEEFIYFVFSYLSDRYGLDDIPEISHELETLSMYHWVMSHLLHYLSSENPKIFAKTQLFNLKKEFFIEIQWIPTTRRLKLR